ncbi:MAG: hypothetical protein ACMV1D_08695 [Macromonas sp.]
MAMSTSIHFSIKYDGPALASHQMDVRELAPALMALSSLLEEANREIYPDGDEVRVQVKGSFKGGSFGVDLIALQSIKDQIVSLLTGPEASAVSNLFGILGGVGLVGGAYAGLIQLIKWLNGRKPTSVTQMGDHLIVEATLFERTESIEVSLVAGKLYKSRVVRQSLAKVLKPLERDGIDIFAAGRDGQSETVIEKDDLTAFTDAAQEADVASDNTMSRVLVQVESAVFKDGNKWRISDGAATFHAAMDDTDFTDRIDAGLERFGKGDVLVVDLRRVQLITDNGLKSEWSIVKVHEHREPLQTTLL